MDKRKEKEFIIIRMEISMKVKAFLFFYIIYNLYYFKIIL